MMKTFDTREAADENIPKGLVVCATLLKDGTPVYFHAHPDTPESDMRAISFEIREGRELSSYEQMLLQAVERQQATNVSVA